MKNYYFKGKDSLLNVTADKKVILVDFFDTLVFRRIHSFQIYKQWAKALVARLGLEDSAAEVLVVLRHQATKLLRKEYSEPPYLLVMTNVWQRMKIGIDKQLFIEHALKADVTTELGGQYGNSFLIHFLREAKRRGQHVYVVSDFYLPASVYDDFLVNAGCEDVVDGVFVSETCNRTKAGGDIYPYVMEQLGISPEACVMIGDSKLSDVKQAEKNGIMALWYFPWKHKIWTNISRKLNLDYSRRILKEQAKYLYHHSLYDEYALVLFYFAQKIVECARLDGVKKLSFVSRGGYFLKKVVDEYIESQHVVDLKTDYSYVSRKVCLAGDRESVKMLGEYLGTFLYDGKLVTVDEGWYCHSQQAISKNLGLSTMGYYLGVRGKDDGYADCERKGILFDMFGNREKPSRYYGIFCTNCSMYEQMLTSREGSVKGYEYTVNGLKPILKENHVEVKLYDEIIASWQRRMLLQIMGLCAWSGSVKVKESLLARMVLRSVLFADTKRCELQRRLDKDMIDNINATKQKPKGVKDVKIDIGKLICHPEMYLGMICKVQRRIYDKPLLNLGYKFVASCFYLYVRLINRI